MKFVSLQKNRFFLRVASLEALRVSAVAGRTLPHMRGPGMTQALISFENGITAIFEAILAPGGTYTWHLSIW